MLRIEAGDQDASLVIVGLQERVPFNSPAGRDLLHRMLEGFPGYSLKSEGTNRWPVMNLSKIVEQNQLIDFVKVLDWMAEQCELAKTGSLMLGSKYLN